MGIRAFIRFKAERDSVRSLVSSIEPLDDLLDKAIFSGDRIRVSKSDDLNEFKGHLVHNEEQVCKIIHWEAISNKLYFIFDKWPKFIESHSKRKYTGFKIPAVRNFVTEDGFFDGIQHKPNIMGKR